MHICVRFLFAQMCLKLRLHHSMPFEYRVVRYILLAKTHVQKDRSPEIATGVDIYISIQSLNNHVFCNGIYIVYSSAQQQHAIRLDSSSAAISIMSV